MLAEVCKKWRYIVIILLNNKINLTFIFHLFFFSFFFSFFFIFIPAYYFLLFNLWYLLLLSFPLLSSDVLLVFFYPCCLQFGQYFLDLWQLFHPKLSEPSIPVHHNKQALLLFWHHVCIDCPENVQLILQNAHVTKNIAFNYILWVG